MILDPVKEGCGGVQVFIFVNNSSMKAEGTGQILSAQVLGVHAVVVC